MAKMSQDEIKKALEQKASAASVKLSDVMYSPAIDAVIFVITRPEIVKDGKVPHAAVTISGLDLLQNSSPDALAKLLDSRFDGALKSLDALCAEAA